MPDTRTFAERTVTAEEPDRESGMACVRKPIQLVRVEPSDTMIGSLVALYDDGSVFECHDGATVWNEVEMPQ